MTQLKTIIFGCLIALFSINASASISFSRSYSNLEITREPVQINGVNYTRLVYEGLKQVTTTGEYDVPVEYVRFSVPSNAVDFELDITSHQCKGYICPSLIAQVLAITCNGDTISLDSNMIEETTCAKIENIGYINGCNKVVTVGLYPAVPRIDDSVYDFYSDISFNLTWKTTSNFENEVIKPVFGSFESMESGIETVKKMVENPGSVGVNVLQFSNDLSPLTLDSEEFTHIVITSVYGWDEEKYIARRGLKGYPTKVVHLSEILNSPKYSMYQRPEEKVREYLKFAYEHYNTKSVFFIGKYPDFPIAYISRYSSGSHSIPSDLFFSEFNTNWKFTSNGVAISPQIDYYPELNIGRIPAQDIQEVENYLDKMYTFEWNPGNGDPSYLHYATLTRQYYNMLEKPFYTDSQMSSFLNAYKDRLIDLSDQTANNISFPTGAEVIQSLNNQRSGCWNFIGHGNPDGIIVRTVRVAPWHDLGITPLDGEYVNLKDEVGNGLDGVNNKDYPSWSYNMSCTMMPFDKISGFENLTYNFGESYILGKNYGGVIFIGNTRESYLDDSMDIMNYFFDLMQENDSYQIDNLNAGTLVSKLKYNPDFDTHEKLVQNLFGDPLVNIWPDEPEKTSYEWNKINNDEYSEYTINTTKNNLYIGVRDLNDPTYSYVTPFSQERLNEIYDDNKILTVYGPLSIPVILPLNITSYDFRANTRHYIEASDVFIGTKINRWEEGDRVLLGSDADVEIHATGNVTIAREIIFDKLASLKIVADGDVDFSYIKVPAGATLRIEANTIKYDPSKNEFEQGSIVELIERNPSKKNIRTRSKESNNFFKEGRCYWYCYQHSWGPTYVDFGIRIAGKEMIDGKEWNRIDLIKRGTHIFENGGYLTDKVDVDDTVIPVAYVREEDGNIYRTYKNIEEQWSEKPSYVWTQLLYGYGVKSPEDFNHQFSELPLYGYGSIGKDVNTGWWSYDHESSTSKVSKIEQFENSGRKYNKYVIEYVYSPGDRTEEMVVIESIGVFGVYSSGEDHSSLPNRANGELIYECLRPALSTRDYNPWLTYVTEGEDNTIIFERDNSAIKLWEYKGNEEGVETVESDIDQSSRWFNLQGMEIAEPATPGIYIRKSGNKVMKVKL